MLSKRKTNTECGNINNLSRGGNGLCNYTNKPVPVEIPAAIIEHSHTIKYVRMRGRKKGEGVKHNLKHLI